MPHPPGRDAVGRLLERFTRAADRFPTLDAYVISRPDLQSPHAAEMGRERGFGPNEVERLADMLPGPGQRLSDLRGPLSRVWNVSEPVPCPATRVRLWGDPVWKVIVFGWRAGDEASVRQLETLAGEADRLLLHGTGDGECPLTRWLIRLAQGSPHRLVQDWWRMPDGKPWLPTWRPAVDGDRWWVVRLVNVFQLSAREAEAFEQPRPPAAGLPQADTTGGSSAPHPVGAEWEDGRSPPVAAFHPLTSWGEILAVLNEPHGAVVWKNDEPTRDKIRKLNSRYNGPIQLPRGRGRQPSVAKAALVRWWDGLREHFDARIEEEETEAESARKTVAERHAYGPSGTVLPGIRGSVKPTRGGRRKKGKGREE